MYLIITLYHTVWWRNVFAVFEKIEQGPNVNVSILPNLVLIPVVGKYSAFRCARHIF